MEKASRLTRLVILSGAVGALILGGGGDIRHAQLAGPTFSGETPRHLALPNIWRIKGPLPGVLPFQGTQVDNPYTARTGHSLTDEEYAQFRKMMTTPRATPTGAAAPNLLPAACL